MQISIRNFRGVAVADIDAAMMTLIGGKNHQGKTSMAEAVAAVLTGEAIPIADVLKSSVKQIIRDGAKTATCKITDGDSIMSMAWPDCQLITEGTALRPLSRMAAGLESILDFPVKERADFLSPYLDAEPTLDDIAKELKSKDIPADVIEKVKEAVKISGIQNVFAQAKEKGTKMKGQWEMLTGEKFGSNKVQVWFPAKYYPALGNQTEEALKAKVAEIQKDQQAGIAAKAVAGMHKEQLETLVASIPALEKDEALFKEQKKRLMIEIAALEKSVEKLSQEKKDLACPHCGGMVKLENGKLEVLAANEDDDIDRATRLQQGKDDLVTYRKQFQDLSANMTTTGARIIEAMDAKKQLEKFNAASENKWDKNLEDVQKALDVALDDLDAFVKKRDVDTIAKNIASNKAIQEVLAPTGIRESKLKKVLAPFNATLQELSAAAGWGNVGISTKFIITMNGRPDFLCSKSENFQIKTIFQLALCGMRKERLVLVDGADIVVGKERNGLIQAIQKAALPVIIFMSFKAKEEMPMLEKIGGRSYWIEDGEIVNG